MKKVSKTTTGSLAGFLTVLLVCYLVFHFSGCVAIPDQSLVVTGGKGEVHAAIDGSCGPLMQPARSAALQATAIDPHGFSVLSWNAHKGADSGWQADLLSFAGKVDFVLLQEASLDQRLLRLLDRLNREWLMGVAFQKGATDIGILSAGKVPALAYCSQRSPEPLIFIPKVALAAIYPLAGMNRELLVVNVHVVNFTLDNEVVRQQIEALQGLIREHAGPVIIAGDFNTWSKSRSDVVAAEMKKLGLQPVSFSPDNRVEFFDHTVDAVYYRGLEVTEASSYPVRSSDHNPLEVHFKLAPAG